MDKIVDPVPFCIADGLTQGQEQGLEDLSTWAQDLARWVLLRLGCLVMGFGNS